VLLLQLPLVLLLLLPLALLLPVLD